MGTPTHIPQNDPYDALIILNGHNWGKIFFQKKSPINSGSHQPRSDPGVGVKLLFCVFHPFLNSPQNSEYFEYRHIGSNKKKFPLPYAQNKISGAHKTHCSVQPFWGLLNPPPPRPPWGRVTGAGSSPHESASYTASSSSSSSSSSLSSPSSSSLNTLLHLQCILVDSLSFWNDYPKNSLKRCSFSPLNGPPQHQCVEQGSLNTHCNHFSVQLL